MSPGGREQTLFRLAPTVNGSNRTSVANGKVVWDEYVPDIRWLRGYSEILIRDLATGRTRRLTHKTRFMNPVLSPDGSRIAVVEFPFQPPASLVILDSCRPPLRICALPYAPQIMVSPIESMGEIGVILQQRHQSVRNRLP